jgi:hypothetical protein
MSHVSQPIQLGTSITDSPFYIAAREHAETERDFGVGLAEFTTAMVAEHGPDANRLEIVSAYAYAWGMVRRAIPNSVRSDFRIIAPEVRREVRAAGYDWETVLEGMGNPTPGIAYAYRDNLSPESSSHEMSSWWAWVLERWVPILGRFRAVD